MMRTNPDYDVIVVGAGPGGATAARVCVQHGLKTLLIEKERFPRYKACGGCLSLKTLRLIDFDLTPVIENVIYGAKFTYRLKNPFFIESKEPIAFMVNRDRFDQFLMEKAVETGAKLIEGEEVIGFVEKEGEIEVKLKRGESLSTHYLIGADGARSVVARHLSLPSEGCDGKGMAIQSEIPCDPTLPLPNQERHFVHLDFGGIPNGYGWVFPKKDRLSIGIGGMFTQTKRVNLRKHLDGFLKGLSYLQGRRPKILKGHPLPSFYDEHQKVSEGRILLVGDAGHLMDPLQGEGIYYAVRSGRLAAEAILESERKSLSPSDVYQRAIHLHISENLKWALTFSRFAFRFTRLAYQTLKSYPELSHLYLQVLEGSKNYQGFVAKVKERIKDFMKGNLSEKIRRAMGRT